MLNVEAVRAFMADDKRIENLPKLYIELYLEDVVDEALEGNENSDNVPTNGIRLSIEPDQTLSRQTYQVLQDEHADISVRIFGIREERRR